MIHKFRRKPAVIEAMQWTNEPGNFTAIKEWAGGYVNSASPILWPTEQGVSMCLEVSKPVGVVLARLGDWVVKYADEEYGVCSPETLHEQYELAM